MPRKQIRKFDVPLINVEALREYFPDFRCGSISSEATGLSDEEKKYLRPIGTEDVHFEAVFLFDPAAKSKDRFFFFFMSTIGTHTTMATDWSPIEFVQMCMKNIPLDKLRPLKSILKGTVLELPEATMGRILSPVTKGSQRADIASSPRAAVMHHTTLFRPELSTTAPVVGAAKRVGYWM